MLTLSARRSRRFPLTLVATLASLIFLLLASAASAQTPVLPPSLEGELFMVIDGEPPSSIDSGDLSISYDCDGQVGERFTTTYSASGIATGPYPGPFTETGTVTSELVFAGGANFAFGTVTTWTATFTIDSPNAPTGATTVTGTKTLTTSVVANCIGERPPGLGVVQTRHQAVAFLTYEATIATAAGRFRDAGQAHAHLSRDTCADGTLFTCAPGLRNDARIFMETFYLSTGVLPLDTSGKATGGGQVVSAIDPFDRVSFGFDVRESEDGSRLHGTCNVIDHTSGEHVKCLTVTSYQQVGNTATWEGSAKVNGVVEDYTITVADNGEPNRGLDTFFIDTESYEAGGPVTYGNVQVHHQPG